MFRVVILLSFLLCLSYGAHTPEVKQQPKAAAVDTSLWTDIGLKEPPAQIKVEYKNNGKVTNVTPGTTLEKIITGPAPKLSWQLEKTTKYAIAMIDPDAPSRKEPTKRSVSVSTRPNEFFSISND